MGKHCGPLAGATVAGEGFEPSKAKPTDLQSAPIGRSGNPPLSSEQTIQPCKAAHVRRLPPGQWHQADGRRNNRVASDPAPA